MRTRSMLLLRRAGRGVLRSASSAQAAAAVLTAHVARAASSAGGAHDSSSGRGDGQGVADAAEKASENSTASVSNDGGVSVSIDRSGLFRPPCTYNAPAWYLALWRHRF